jgi:L,D-transpeptidase catalytic domain
MSQKVLAELNRSKAFNAGDDLVVADVGPSNPSVQSKARSIEIDKSERMLFVLAAEDKVIAAFPVSIGGPRDPLPLGKMKITNEVKNPSFTYDPKLIRGAKAGDVKTEIRPGPNNPVGNMWLGQQAALGDSRHTGSQPTRARGNQRLRPHDQLGRAAAVEPRKAGLRSRRPTVAMDLRRAPPPPSPTGKQVSEREIEPQLGSRTHGIRQVNAERAARHRFANRQALRT